ncbi:hypothetical protein PbB2_01772 [Candidatus Phycosocius bacilliformis]|uniref:HTH hxlR-type domain-containing protein n=1 Tax=Candidatus Phycosocius bacilliformis TaxID=1445552 RepID=A0A2P2EAK0_9PROT|nr:winged helix-turn-helix transcriptional regulator [Candidatus Phycosocius bacilliformis]GBF58101.1 hypothetical protein PbB2_01772 [Candidatus Phycosocius bacilliformis]
MFFTPAKAPQAMSPELAQFGAEILAAMEDDRIRHEDLVRQFSHVRPDELSRLMRELEDLGMVSRRHGETDPAYIVYDLLKPGRSVRKLVTTVTGWFGVRLSGRPR